MAPRYRLGTRIFISDHSGWDLMMLVPSENDGSSPAYPAGSAGTAARAAPWRTDTSRGLTGILLTQRMVTSPAPVPLVTDFWAAAYAAIDAS